MNAVVVLEAACWCEQRTVGVHAAELKAGRTGSCTNPWCRPPDGVEDATPVGRASRRRVA